MEMKISSGAGTTYKTKYHNAFHKQKNITQNTRARSTRGKFKHGNYQNVLHTQSI